MLFWHKIMALAILASLIGCCPIANPRREPPPPITLEEQASRLNDWSHQMPLLKATTVLAGVRFDYRDDQGQAKSENAEGTLLIQQHFSTAPGILSQQDVLLRGRAFDQPVFEAGRNDQKWWFIIRLDTKKAWVGDATKPFESANLSVTKTDSASILRADLVPQLIGLSPLVPQDVSDVRGNITDRHVLMLVDDDHATNHLLIERISPELVPESAIESHALNRPRTVMPRTAFIEREIIVDRFTGQVTEVRLYDPTGKVVVRSLLEDYKPVAFAADAPKPIGAGGWGSSFPGGGIPQFPHKVTVTYPGQHMTIALQFDTGHGPVQRPPSTAFQTPDFTTEGLRVINVP